MRKLFGISAAAALLAGASLASAAGGINPTSAFAACPASTPANTTDSCNVLATVVLGQGVLSLQAPNLNNFVDSSNHAPTLTGQNQTVTASWTNVPATSPALNGATFRVTDATGTGNGWNVTAQSAPFSCVYSTTNARCPSAGDSFPTSELTGGSFASSSCSTYTLSHCGTGRETNPTTATLTSGTAIDSSVAGTTSVKEFTAAVTTGMGTFDITLNNLSLVVPADAYAATYTTTITYTLASTP